MRKLSAKCRNCGSPQTLTIGPPQGPHRIVYYECGAKESQSAGYCYDSASAKSECARRQLAVAENLLGKACDYVDGTLEGIIVDFLNRRENFS